MRKLEGGLLHPHQRFLLTVPEDVPEQIHNAAIGNSQPRTSVQDRMVNGMLSGIQHPLKADRLALLHGLYCVAELRSQIPGEGHVRND